MRLSGVCTWILISFPALTTAADPKDDPKAIVDKAIQAVGGAEKLEKVKSHSWKTKGAMTAMGMTLNFTADYTFAAPDKFRFDLDMDAGGMKIKLSAATDGKSAWEQMGDMMREMEKEKAIEFNHARICSSLHAVPVERQSLHADVTGESNTESNRRWHHVIMKGNEMSMFFDKKTGLRQGHFGHRRAPVMLRRTCDGGLLRQRWSEGSTRCRFHRRQETGRGNVRSEDVEKVDEKMFAKPAAK
jgi:hypothetical protein